MLERVSHVGLAVKDLEAAIQFYERVFGMRVARRWTAEKDRMEAALLESGGLEIELMQPLEDDSPVGRFIARRGEGIHHVAYRVDDVAEALRQVREAGVETIDQEPRVGGGGRTRVGFLHPRGTYGVLTELEQEC
jgi:methylmalonyl-CoA/ethylmalonyl-CoA epimerase